MKQKHTIMFAALAIVAALAMPGCEKDTSIDGLDKWFENNPYVSDPRTSADQTVVIDPAVHSVTYVGQQVVFKVSGGTAPYTWAVANTSRGTITRSPGGTRTPHPSGSYSAVYTTKIVGDNSVIAYDQYLRAALADITGSTSSLKITPATATLDNPSVGVTVQLIGTGGSKPYESWSTAYDWLGTVDANGLYTVTSSGAAKTGDNIVTLIDAVGEITTATMTHTGPAALEILGGNRAFVGAGTIQFNAAGGDGNYTWSDSGIGALGAIDPVTGLYTALAANGQQTITVTDGVLNSVLIILTQTP